VTEFGFAGMQYAWGFGFVVVFFFLSVLHAVVFWPVSALLHHGAVCCLGACQVISVLQQDQKNFNSVAGIAL